MNVIKQLKIKIMEKTEQYINATSEFIFSICLFLIAVAMLAVGFYELAFFCLATIYIGIVAVFPIVKQWDVERKMYKDELERQRRKDTKQTCMNCIYKRYNRSTQIHSCKIQEGKRISKTCTCEYWKQKKQKNEYEYL